MARKTVRYRAGAAEGTQDAGASGSQGDKPPEPKTVKVTLTLSFDTARRLGVAAANRRVSQSHVAEELMGPPLRRWRLQSEAGAPAADGAGQANDAA